VSRAVQLSSDDRRGRRRMRHRRSTTTARLVTLVLLAVAARAHAGPGPWRRTETRQPCASFSVFRQPYFGDTHVHTSYSSDAVFAVTGEDPRGPCRFRHGH